MQFFKTIPRVRRLILSSILYIICQTYTIIAFSQTSQNSDQEDWQYEEVIIYAGDKTEQDLDKLINDPHEKLNRHIFKFNKWVDHKLLKPAASTYRAIVPKWGRDRVSCFLDNLKEPLYLLHGILILDNKQIGTSIGRFVTNTLFGMGGLLDPATSKGLVRRRTNAGKTLGAYGIPTGPYIVLPFLGPSTLRDIIGKILDFKLDPSNWPLEDGVKLIVLKIIVDGVVKREYLLDYSEEIEKIALDEYSTLRSLYIQKSNKNDD